MSTSSETGQRTLATVLSALVEQGYLVAIPFGEGAPYDLVVDLDGELLRAQCKTGRLRKGAVLFPSSKRAKQWSSRTITHQTYGSSIDIFLVYCPETLSVYWVPPADVAEGMGSLRVDPCLNGQQKGVRWALHYVLKPAPSALAS